LKAAPAAASLRLLNARTGAVVASSVEVARTSAARRRGLLGRAGLPAGAALMLTRCNAIHTVGMRFPIDVVFLDSRGTARKIVAALPPWRMAVSLRASSVVELAAGALSPGLLQEGDTVRLEEAPGGL
jgi:uncharacterized membrane protein (UPF0127 family)